MGRARPGGDSQHGDLPGFSLDEAALGSIVVEKAEAIGRYPFEVRRLAMDTRWVRSALS